MFRFWFLNYEFRIYTMEYYQVLLMIVFLHLDLHKAPALPTEISSTRMCLKDDYYICKGDLNLAGLAPHSIGFSGMVNKTLEPICIINLQNGYKDKEKKCYGDEDSNDTMLHFVLNKTTAEYGIHTELEARFLYENGNGKPEQKKIVKWVVKAPKVLQYQVQVNGVFLNEDKQCNIEVTKEDPDLKVVYNCNTDSFQEECKLIISDETEKQVRVVSERNKTFVLDMPILLKGSTFNFKLQVCQHRHFFSRCTVNVAKAYYITNDDWHSQFIVVTVIFTVFVVINLTLWVICMRHRHEKKYAKGNFLASADLLIKQPNEKGDIV